MFCGKIGLLHSRWRSQWRFKTLTNVCLDDVFWTTEDFVTKLCMFMQHHEPECHAEKLVQWPGHTEGLCNQNMTVFTISSKLLVHLQINLASYARVCCGNIGLLRARSRSQWSSMCEWNFALCLVMSCWKAFSLWCVLQLFKKISFYMLWKFH